MEKNQAEGGRPKLNTPEAESQNVEIKKQQINQPLRNISSSTKLFE